MAYKHHKYYCVFLLAIVATPIDCALYLICSSHLLMHTSGLLFVDKNRQQHKSLKLQGAHGVCALRALVISALTLIVRSTLGPGQTNWNNNQNFIRGRHYSGCFSEILKAMHTLTQKSLDH